MTDKKRKKKKEEKTTDESFSVYDFSEPVAYSTTTFGLEDEQVSVFTIDLNVASLEKNFQIFEELQNVHEWPISKLIQRELDHKRATDICNDYLLVDGYIKYFPPLTAVLIPTESAHLPTDMYPEIRSDELEALKVKIIKPREEKYKDYDDPEVAAGGVYIVSYDYATGDIIWDKNIVSAVIIDGQHRYKSLLEASARNKEFNKCRVVVNLIDLIPICEKQKRGPTDVARDLFVTINNTPEEVDESRLVLMDDRDALATFTQVLVDDSDKNRLPAVQPELIDWACVGNKHDIEQSLTGVLTLRQVIQSAIFDNLSMSSIDDRQNHKKVSRWIDKLKSWVNPDDKIREKLGNQETLKSRFDVASIDIVDDGEEESLFLFTYSGAAARIIKELFKELYLDVFRKVYTDLAPYDNCYDIAGNAGLFDKNSSVHRYFRAFSGQRKELLKDISTKKEVETYKNKFKNLTVNSIPHSVMGQKAIFKTLFEYYLAEETDYDPKSLFEITNTFVDNFNELYTITTPTLNVDENLFNTKYKLKKGIESTKAGDLGREFWRGIILKHNGEIDYSNTAVSILESVILNMMQFYINTNSEDAESEEFRFSQRAKIIQRHVRIIKTFNDEMSDDNAKEIAENIVEGKEKHIQNLIIS